MDHTSPTPRRRKGLAIAAALSLAVAVSACSASSGDEQGAGEDGTITLTVATFNEFGYEELFEEYEAANPGISIKHKKSGTAPDHQDNLYTKLAAGSGLSDIEAVEVDWLAALVEQSDQFVDLTDPELEGRWLDWKADAATTPDGKLIGYGTDIGPEAICYRSDLFESAGLPTDRAEVATLFPTWEDYFAVGRDFVDEVPDTAWFDSTGGIAQAMVNQVEYSFEDADNNVIAAENPEVKEILTRGRRASTRPGRPSSPTSSASAEGHRSHHGRHRITCSRRDPPSSRGPRRLRAP